MTTTVNWRDGTTSVATPNDEGSVDVVTTPSYEPKVGDIFVTSWGYDQTNVDAFQVVGVTKSGKSVRVQSIATEETGRDHVRPAKDQFTNSGDYVRDEYGDPVRDGSGRFVREPKVETKRVKVWDYRGETEVSFKWTSFASAHKWDGERDFYVTPYGFGH